MNPNLPRSSRSLPDFDRRMFNTSIDCVKTDLRNCKIYKGPSASSERRSLSSFKMAYETSFWGNKPIPTRSLEQGSEPPPKDPADINSIARTTLTRVQVHEHVPLQSSSRASPEFELRGRRTSSAESPKSSDHYRKSPCSSVPFSKSSVIYVRFGSDVANTD